MRCSVRVVFLVVLGLLPIGRVSAQIDDKAVLESYRQAAMEGGDSQRGERVFESKDAGCRKCHAVAGNEKLAGPNLGVVGDKLRRPQLIQAVLEPSSSIHPDFASIVVQLKDGKSLNGVLKQRTQADLQLFDSEGTLIKIPLNQIDEETRSPISLMPLGLNKLMTAAQFADLIAYLESRKQAAGEARTPGLPSVILPVQSPIRLVPLHTPEQRFDHPVWIVAIPTLPGEYLVVEQKTRQIWRLIESTNGTRRELFVDLSKEATTGEFEGTVCLAFHPQFPTNRKYYVNYHVRNQGSHFSPVIVERLATADLRNDSGQPSRRLLQIHQDTDLHWGGMLAFGPDGYLYIGAGDAGPQEDPEGHSQDLSLLTGSILRIDVDHKDAGKEYAIPESNPFRTKEPPVRPEIWAYGYRMPWRFSFDSATGDLWVGDIGQNLFEEVSICRQGENHGWNVFEGFMKFSDQFRREGEKYTAPIFSYRRELGVSVTGGYVYHGHKNPTFVGTYIFGDFESKRIWALTQSDRQLIKVRQIGDSSQRISSFGIDHDGEILLVGYEGTISRIDLTGSDFNGVDSRKVRISVERGGIPAAARVSAVGRDDVAVGPLNSPLRKTTGGDTYFYLDNSAIVELPPGEAHIDISGGLETIPQRRTLQINKDSEVDVQLQSWIDLPSRGWYSGDSHVHLHTGGPIQVNVNDALVAARAEGIHYVNLCVSNNVGDDIRDPELITGRPHAASTPKHVLSFGEEMRSMIYGHMQFFGIKKLVEPQYTGFDGTPFSLDFPANFAMAAEAVRQGGVVTYGHPLFTGQPFPFENDLAKPNGAARELPIDAILGVVHAIDLMSYNSDEPLSTELWYRLLNCGIRLSACVGTDALLDRSTDPMGGDRVYVQIDGALTMECWLDGLKKGRTFVTNGPVPMLKVNGQGLGGTVRLTDAGSVQVNGTVESLVPIHTVEIIQNGEVVFAQTVEPSPAGVTTVQVEREIAFKKSGWVALRVRGNNHARVFDGPAFAHTSAVYVTVRDQPIVSATDADFFIEWIEQLTRVVAARNRYATKEDRHQVEALFRKAITEFQKRR